MKIVNCIKTVTVGSLNVKKGDVLKVKRLPLISKLNADSVFVFLTEDGDQFVASESMAKAHFSSTTKVEVPNTRPKGMSMVEYARIKVEALGIDYTGRCTCPRCGGSGEWRGGRTVGACFLCSRQGEVSELQAMMHHIKMSERREKGLN